MKLAGIALTVALLAGLGTAQTTRTLPSGASIKVRTDTAIPAKPAANTKYTGTISGDVVDTSGSVAIPRGARAQLVAVPTDNGKDTVLDLRSVNVNGRSYLVTTQTSTKSSGPGGLGVNKRTGMFVGGGALVGGILGGLFGGGKGAAIGALAGGGAGAGTQVLTGRKKEIPAETELSYKTAQELQLRPVATSTAKKSGLHKRTTTAASQ